MTEHGHITTDDVRGSLRLAGQVERYHTWPITKPTVADSTWHVLRIYLQVFGSPRAEVWEYVLLHDADEIATGDVPFYAKRRYPLLKAALDWAEDEHRGRVGRRLPAIDATEWHRFKACDLLEMHEFARVQTMMGNQFAWTVVHNVEEALANMQSALGPEDWVRVHSHMSRRLP